ncbi:hypothetical protein D3C78_1444140 [compost metagenome]
MMRPMLQPWITQLPEMLQHVAARQAMAEQLARLAIAKQQFALGITDHGRHRQVFQAVGNEAPGVAGATHGLFQGHDLALQAVAAGVGGAATFREDLGLRVQAGQLPAEIGQHHAQAPPIPDQVAEHDAQHTCHGRPPPASRAQHGTDQQGQAHAAHCCPQGQARAQQQQAQYTGHQTHRQQHSAWMVTRRLAAQ